MTRRWSDADRDAAYTEICDAISAVGRDGEARFLARLALLLAEELGDLPATRRAIAAAKDSLAQPPSGQQR